MHVFKIRGWKMRIIGSILFILAFSLMPIWISAEEIEMEGPIEIVEKFLIASQNGEVEVMKTLIAGPYYERRKELLEDNKAYPDFLRKYFEEVFVRIVEVENQEINGSVMVVLENEVNNGHIINTKLILRKDQTGAWKIFDELLE
jgi:hypothetical protein